MREKVSFKAVDLYYRQYGDPSNTAVVLLHGYLESLDIWEGFADELAKKYYVVSIDLPGHGQSGIYAKVHRMDDMAGSIVAVAAKLGIKRFHLVGHSMGGYVTMAFREEYQEKLYSFVLFHSTCYADPEEKKNNRDREIGLVEAGKKESIVNTNIPKAFADDNLERLAAEIERAKSIALNSPDNGIIAILRGMKNRPDRCALLKDDIIPLLVIGGVKDNYIPIDVIRNMPKHGSNVEIAELGNSGHMGFIEEREKSLEILDAFFRKISG